MSLKLNGYSDDHFEEARDNLLLDEPCDWQLFTQTNTVKFFRNYLESSGLYEYKVFGVLPDVDLELCAQVYKDLEYRKQWDTYVNELTVLCQDDSKEMVYWQVNFPWPMSNREYIFLRDYRLFPADERHPHPVHVFLLRSVVHKNAGDSHDDEAIQTIVPPSKKGVIRVTTYSNIVALTSDGKEGTKAYMYHRDNPEGSIPSLVINWAAKQGVPAFIETTRKACLNYASYKNKSCQSPESG